MLQHSRSRSRILKTLYNQKDAKGFIKLFGLPLKVQALVDKKR